MSIYESDPRLAPDSEFEGGSLSHFVVGNRGRMLDSRRTPVSIVAVRVDVGFVTIQIEAFEDAGAQWDIPFEEVGHYQFELGSERAGASDVERFRLAVEQFDRRLEIPCDMTDRQVARATVDEEQHQADEWLGAHSSFFAAGGTAPPPEDRTGDPRLFEDLRTYMAQRGLGEMEEAFARQFVSNPYAGEIVKGHRIVLAWMGVVPYEGTIVRDPATFEGSWDEAHRRSHIEARLGFVRAMFGRLGQPRLLLYRGMSTSGPIRSARNHTFVSATFSRLVAHSHFDGAGPGASRMLVSLQVPVERVLMTYLETAAMNEQFKEAEAVLLFEPGHAQPSS